MARIRTLKPQWVTDRKLGSCSDSARFLSAAMITLADDYGNAEAEIELLAAQIWPYKVTKDPVGIMETAGGALRELCEIDWCRLYKIKGETFFTIVNWSKHQRITNAGKPTVPPPGTLAASRGESRRVAATSNAPEESRGESRLEGEREEEKEREEERGRTPNSKSEQIQNPGLDADPKSAQGPEHEPPLPSHDPSPCRPDSVAEVYRECSKNRDVGDMSPCWTTRQRDAISTMSSWCGGDLGKLEAELKALHAADSAGKKPWLIHQPAHIWAERLGTAPPIDADPDGKLAIAERRRKAEAAEQAEREQRKEAERNMAPNGGELGREIMANLARTAKCKA